MRTRRFRFTFVVDVPAKGHRGDEHEGAEPPEQALANDLSYWLCKRETGHTEITSEQIELYGIRHEQIVQG